MNETMSSQHKKRINTFLLSAIDKPIEVDEYKDQHYQPRGKSYK